MPAAVRKEGRHGLKKPAGELKNRKMPAGKNTEEWDKARKRLLSPDDKSSDAVRKAVSKEDRRRKANSGMRGIRRRVEMIENRDGLDDTLSRSLDDTVASEGFMEKYGN